MSEAPAQKQPPPGFKTWAEFYEYGATVILPQFRDDERERDAARVPGIKPPPPRGSRSHF